MPYILNIEDNRQCRHDVCLFQVWSLTIGHMIPQQRQSKYIQEIKITS